MQNAFRMKGNSKLIRIRIVVLILGILIIVAGGAFFLFNYLNTIKQVESVDKQINTFLVQFSGLTSAEKQFFAEERTSTYFFRTGESTYIDEFNRKYNNCKRSLRALRDNPRIRLYGLQDELEELYTALLDYEDNFLKLTEVIRTRGYKHFGLIKKLNQNHHKIDSLVNDVPDSVRIPGAKVNLLRNYQQNFVYGKEQDMKNNFLSSVNTLKDSISQNENIDVGVRNKLLIFLEKYRVNFNQLLAKEKQLGNVNESGLTGRVNTNVQNIQAISQEVVNKLNKKKSEEITEAQKSLLLIIPGIFVLVLGIGIGIYFTIQRPFKRIQNYVTELIKGKYPRKGNLKNRDEITDVINLLNDFVDGMLKKATFIRHIGAGEYSASVPRLSDEDELGNALIEMRDQLKQKEEEEEKHKEKDEKDDWVNNSLNEFNNIIKSSGKDIEKISYTVMAKLIEYLDANQGGLFLYNSSDDQPKLELVASYAYGKQKRLKKDVMLKEGVVGTCAIEKKSIYLDDIPDDYPEIVSALGNSKPRYLFLVPLLSNNQIMGVIEIASFYHIPDYKRNFLLTVSESIASTLENIKVNQQTQELLDKTRKQSDELSAQDEEMRQNLEELKTMQEESARREAELKSIIEAINATFLYLEFDMESNVTYANKAFLDTFGLVLDKVKEKNLLQLEGAVTGNQEKINRIWEKMRKGLTERIDEKIEINDIEAQVSRTFAPILDNQNKPVKVICLATNNTETYRKYEELKTTNQQLESQQEEMIQNIEQMRQSNEELERIKNKENKLRQHCEKQIEAYRNFLMDVLSLLPERIYIKDSNGKIIFANNAYAQKYGLSSDEIQNKTIYDLVDEETAKGIEEEEKLIRKTSGKTYNYEEKKPEGTEVFMTTKFPLQIRHLEDTGIICFEQNISQLKTQEQELNKQCDNYEETLKEKQKIIEDLQYKNSQLIAERINTNQILSVFDEFTASAELSADGTIIKVNERLQYFTGYGEDELVDGNFSDFVKENSRLKRIWSILGKAENYHGYLTIISKGNESIPLLFIITPFVDDEGIVEKYVLYGIRCDILNN